MLLKELWRATIGVLIRDFRLEYLLALYFEISNAFLYATVHVLKEAVRQQQGKLWASGQLFLERVEHKRNRYRRLPAITNSNALHDELNCLLSLVLVCHMRNVDLPTFRGTVCDVLLKHASLIYFGFKRALL